MNKSSKFNVLVSLERRVLSNHMTERQRHETMAEMKKSAKEALVYAISNFKNGRTDDAKSALAHAVDCLSMFESTDH